jgi:hypothetical protein
MQRRVAGVQFGVDRTEDRGDIFGNSLLSRGEIVGTRASVSNKGFRRIRMKKSALFLATLFCVVSASAPLLAHHGEANYDTDKMVSVKGIVTQFEFINPHVQITLDVKSDKGEVEKWVGEARSPAMLSRYGGWDKDTIKVGEVITFYGHRTKNGTPFMRLDKIVKADGTELPNL